MHVGDCQRQAPRRFGAKPSALERGEVLPHAVQGINGRAGGHQSLRRRQLVPYREAGSRIDEQGRRSSREEQDETEILVRRAGQLERTTACRDACLVRIRMAGREPFEAVRQCLWADPRPRHDASSDRNRRSLREGRDHPPGRLPCGDHDHARAGDGAEDTLCLGRIDQRSRRDGLESPAENVLKIVAKNRLRGSQ